jgi:hypothetical protein
MKLGTPLLALLLALLIFTALATSTLVGCTSQQTIEAQQPLDGSVPESAETYKLLIERYSAGDSEYTGFYNTFEYKALFLNSAVRGAIFRKQMAYYQWDAAKAAAEREKMHKELDEETRFFMSFFTPDRQNDNLMNSKSIWKVYLDAGGHRYEGRIKRLRTLLAELQSIYPFHTRWTTPYEISFPVSTHAIETLNATYTVTGPLGTRVVEIRGMKP